MNNNPNKGKVLIVLAVLAAIWIVVGTILIIGYAGWLKDRSDTNSGTGNTQTQQEETEDDEDDEDEDDDDLIDDDVDDVPNSSDDDDDVVDDYDDAPVTNNNDDQIVNYQRFTVDAWDGFAAVRTGRGTQYEKVGEIYNGEQVAVKDLQNGWYEIAEGRWQGYYLHKSSLR